MIADITFSPAAMEELSDAARYYAREDTRVGLAFVGEIEACVEWIGANPRAAPILRDSIRRKLASRFPYAVFYRATEAGIRVLAIAHLKRRPFYWLGRE